VRSAIEFGCGDGHQLTLVDYPRYTGVDVSETIVRHCAPSSPAMRPSSS
jgi:hypothetical protein